MLAFRCIFPKLLPVVVNIIFLYAVNARTVKMDYLLFTFMPWVLICGSKMKRRWVCTHVITFNVGFKNPSCHILFREFSSFLRSTSLWYCTSALLHDSRSRAVQRRVYDSVLYLFSLFFLNFFFYPHCWLKVTFMGHPDKAILPAAQTRPVFSTDFLIHLYSLFFFSGDPGSLLWSTAPK